MPQKYIMGVLHKKKYVFLPPIILFWCIKTWFNNLVLVYLNDVK